jgi:hypothetical protein
MNQIQFMSQAKQPLTDTAPTKLHLNAFFFSFSDHLVTHPVPTHPILIGEEVPLEQKLIGQTTPKP